MEEEEEVDPVDRTAVEVEAARVAAVVEDAQATPPQLMVETPRGIFTRRSSLSLPSLDRRMLLTCCRAEEAD